MFFPCPSAIFFQLHLNIYGCFYYCKKFKLTTVALNKTVQVCARFPLPTVGLVTSEAFLGSHCSRGGRLAPRRVDPVVSCVYSFMFRSTADIPNLLLPWHCPSTCHASLASVYRSYPLLLPLCSSRFSVLTRAGPTFERWWSGFRLSCRRLFLSLFTCLPQCNTTPAAAYSNNLQYTTV